MRFISGPAYAGIETIRIFSDIAHFDYPQQQIYENSAPSFAAIEHHAYIPQQMQQEVFQRNIPIEHMEALHQQEIQEHGQEWEPSSYDPQLDAIFIKHAMAEMGLGSLEQTLLDEPLDIMDHPLSEDDMMAEVMDELGEIPDMDPDMFPDNPFVGW